MQPPDPRPTRASPSLVVAGVGKKYCREPRRSLLYALSDLARAALGARRPPALRPGEFWALEDVSFSLARGESLAVIGANGAGKSTLLRVVHGRIPPDAGSVTVQGRLAAISDLGLGFDPRLSGRANARHAAELLGVGGEAGEDRLAAIVDFSDLGPVIDAPVGTYSTGMRARLGFAVMAQLAPDVLMIDEALAVGDFTFRRKCIRHLGDAAAAGRSMLLVSHDLYTLQLLCARALVLEAGRVVFDGPISDAIAFYLESQRRREPGGPAVDRRELTGERPVAIDAVELRGVGGAEATSGEPAEVVVRYRSRQPLSPVPWFFQVVSADQTLEIAGGIGALEEDGQVLVDGPGELVARIPRLPLLAGNYGLRAALVEPRRRSVLALHGWSETPSPLRVAPPRDETVRLLKLSHSLVEIETERRPGAARD